MEVDYIFKIVVLGDSGVGKSSFIHQLNNEGNIHNCVRGSTIGVDFTTYYTNVHDKKIKLQIWDTAGQEQFRSITKSYFRNVTGALVFFDISNKQSYENVKGWLTDLNDNGVDDIAIFCIANKSDSITSPSYNTLYDNVYPIYKSSSINPNYPRYIMNTFSKHLYTLYKQNKLIKGIRDVETSKPVVITPPIKQSRCYC